MNIEEYSNISTIAPISRAPNTPLTYFNHCPQLLPLIKNDPGDRSSSTHMKVVASPDHASQTQRDARDGADAIVHS